ncbi:MAG: hypothetical protein QM520_07120 [Gammaproteobacteria bacterium]|nr:hypothetical protein [Gammaproteobacteria bacterium]
MIEKEKLQYWAMQLEKEIAKNIAVSSCAKQLSQASYVLEAIEDAKNLKVDLPSERLGSLAPFYEYTDSLNFLSLANALASFNCLLEGRKLQSDKQEHDHD